MKIITVDKDNVVSGFDQLVEARANGEFAVWEFGGYTTTTDDVPDNFARMNQDDIINHMQRQAIARKSKLDGTYGMSEAEQLRSAYEADGEIPRKK